MDKFIEHQVTIGNTSMQSVARSGKNIYTKFVEEIYILEALSLSANVMKIFKFAGDGIALKILSVMADPIKNTKWSLSLNFLENNINLGSIVYDSQKLMIPPYVVLRPGWDLGVNCDVAIGRVTIVCEQVYLREIIYPSN